MNTAKANKLLPAKPTQSKINPSRLVILLIGEPKWGKTKFFMSNKDALLLAFEEGHKFQRGHKVVIDMWDKKRGAHDIWKDDEGVPHMTFKQANEVLNASDRFNFVIFDTVDMAVKMCIDHHCGVAGAAHPTDMGDYGKGWDTAQNTPFRRGVMDILKTGRGVGFIAHSKVEVQRFTSGEKARKECGLPAGIRRLCESQADVIMHGEFGKRRAGLRLRDRILVCEGDMDVLAGNRSGTMLPARYIVDPDGPWDQFAKFFTSAEAADKAENTYRKIYGRRE